MPTPTPTLRGRRLGARLRHLRAATDPKLTMDDVAERLGERGKWSTTKVSRIENGLVKVHVADLIALLDLYKASEEVRDELTKLYRTSDQRGTWLSSFGSVLNSHHTQYLDLENDADSIFEFGSIVPGLLQTPDYARALMEPMPGLSKDFIDQRVELRMLRKQVFEKSSPLRLWSVMDESAVHRMVGRPAVMHRQLQYLSEMAEHPNINIQIIPFNTGAHVSMDAPFSIIDFDDYLLPSVLYMEHSTYAIYEEDEQVLRDYRLKYDLLQSTALSVSNSRSLINSLPSRS
jgi:transcriptional regulator with XRE-family HTH domain